jgi:hypothetical protein
LWLAGGIIIVAAGIVFWSLRAGTDEHAAV